MSKKRALGRLHNEISTLRRSLGYIQPEGGVNSIYRAIVRLERIRTEINEIKTEEDGK